MAGIFKKIILLLIFLPNLVFAYPGDAILDDVQPEGGGTLDITNIENSLGSVNLLSDTTGIALDEIEDPTVDHTFTMSNKILTWRFTNPNGGIFYEWIGNAQGHLFELQQNTGVPSAGTHLLHIEWANSNVIGLHLEGNASTDISQVFNVTGDADNRLEIYADGKFDWGDGTNAPDTNLYRDSPNNLRTDDAFQADDISIDNPSTIYNLSHDSFSDFVSGEHFLQSEITEVAASFLVIESEGIASNDNDLTIPTSAAVKDYVDSFAGGGDVDSSDFTADGDFLVGTGMGTYQAENGNTARTSLGLGTGNSPTFTALTLSGGQIAFPSSQNASSDANTLDDYEEGTWAITLTPETSGSITLDSSFDLGAYVKIGKVVHVQGAVQVTSVSSPLGDVRISLPFAISSLGEWASFGAKGVGVSNVDYTADYLVLRFTTTGVSYFYISQVTDNSGWVILEGGAFSGGSIVSFDFEYITAN